MKEMNGGKMELQVCTRCLMDTTTSTIVFDDEGVCNYCKDLTIKLQKAKKIIENEILHRDMFIKKLKEDGKGKRYNCIVGVSGGVDSSYALYLAVKNGLRPLAVHLDNGWNSELSVHNISNLVNRLGVDLYTHVIDWEENRDLQLSMFKANVVDIEMLMDNAMLKLNYDQANKHGVKYILAGTNIATEGMQLPIDWVHYKTDKLNIKQIHKRFGTIKIKTHPLISTFERLWYEKLKGIHWISFLDYFPYNKQEALDILQKEVEYKPYPYKHYESVFTRFYQAYILPRKFGIDKRKVHLSTLVLTGQMDREAALSELKNSPYPDPEQEKQDIEFVMKKLGFTKASFEEYMYASKVPHEFYGSEWNFYIILKKVYNKLFQKK